MAPTIYLPMDAMREIKIAVSRAVKANKLAVPAVSEADLFSHPLDIRLIDLEQVDGNTTLREQILIVALAKRRDAQKVFEFGTFDGKTSANLAANLGPEAEILTIDLEAAQAGATRMSIGKKDLRFVRKDQIGAKLGSFSGVVQLFGDTGRFDFSPWYRTRDLVFVDACHEYQYVRNDTEIAFKLLQPSGLLIWHDYGTWVGVTRALNEFYVLDPRFRALRHIAGTAICFLEVGLDHPEEPPPVCRVL
ncbi:MAG: class I SAM-dependent methyltransferase [Deltaproteobacteria bacterium]|nr:class I SAM-dependent methyltransferase [Deltaproteobacteria bacterium]